MGKLSDEIVSPIEENKEAYDRLYAEYKLLYDYFGRGANDAMKRLKTLKGEVKAEKLAG
jgi:L-ribulokinase